MTDKTASGAEEQRQFLKQFADSTTPWTWVDIYGHSHQVYLTRANEQMALVTLRLKGQTVRAWRQVMAITMIEAILETHEAGATGEREKELFLLDCADLVAPQQYVDKTGSKHYVYITHLESKHRALSNELVYGVKFIDAWGGAYVQQAEALTVTIAKTVTIQTHVKTAYGYGAYGFGQYEASL